jgi:prolyl-tRNA synthetase
MEKVLQDFKKLSISSEQKTHKAVESLADWVETVKGMAAVPTKTLVLKPKGSETLLFVVSLESAKFSIGGLAKSLGLKDARAATDDVVLETFKTARMDSTALLN